MRVQIEDVRDEAQIVWFQEQPDLRDRFAMAALPSVIAVCGRDTRDADVGYPQHCAAKAYEIADAMMEARK